VTAERGAACVSMTRRAFLDRTIKLLLACASPSQVKQVVAAMQHETAKTAKASAPITLFLCGDVMTGRGIDQVLPHPGNPVLHEPYASSALAYVELAEARNGSIDKPVDFAYIWGDALSVFKQLTPDVRIINLETAITTSDDYWPGKAIHYRMHPKNIPCLTAAKIDCCVLANNHVLDFGYPGLHQTLQTLHKAHIQTAGAGEDSVQAAAPAIMDVTGKGRVIVFAYADASSGVSEDWAASPRRPGVNYLKDFSTHTVKQLARNIHTLKQAGDIVVVSIHWGANWGYGITPEQKSFAHRLIDEASVDILHCHSSHHPKGIEVYQHKPILYGCGDFLNDYEGISGYEEYRDDLTLMYFVSMDPATGQLTRLHLVPIQIKHFRCNRASAQDAQWLRDMLNTEGAKLGTRAHLNEDGSIELSW
jgi:poly-gamma-glutamate capsule biosynthesis protein CapA/YwtB (metallophosphatase superfamily)